MSAKYEVRGEIAVITLDNPPLNGLGHATRVALLDGLRRAHADAAVRAIVLCGAGRGFSSGADIKEFAAGTVFAEPNLLTVIAAVEGGGVPGAESSMLKIRGTVIRQELNALLRRAMGPQARPFEAAALDGGLDAAAQAALPGPDEAATAAASYFNNRKLSIFGGSNEIQRNIISKMILGL